MTVASTLPDPLHLWRVFREYLQHSFALFGAPADLAKRLWLPRAEHTMLCGWLRPLEALLRLLVFLEALKLGPQDLPAPRERKRRPRAGFPANAGASFDIEHSETWRTRLALFPRPRAPRTGKRNHGAPLINAMPTAPSALRLEAIIRGFNDPAPLALQLACTLRAHPERAAPLLEEPSEAQTARDIYPHVTEAIRLVRAAVEPKPLQDSS